jgi:hypothetical protein
MRRRKLSLLFSMGLVAGILVAGPVPAVEAQPRAPFSVSQFIPNDTPSCPGCIPDFLSDKVPFRAQLGEVGTAESQRNVWFVCPEGLPNPPSNADLASCSIRVGEDDVGRIPPIGPGAVGPTDKAFDIEWDIPGSLDQQRRDILALVCIGAGEDLDGADANCRFDLQRSIFLEDAQTGNAANQTSSGRITVYRTLQSCIGSVAPSCDPAYKELPNGGSVPNDGFDFRVTTSDDVPALRWNINSPADAQQEPATGNLSSSGSCVLEATFTTTKRWRCTVSGADVPDDAEMALSVVSDNAGGTQPEGQGGYCNSNNNPASAPSAQNEVPGAHGQCVLDTHYAVSSARQAARFVQTFAPNPPSPAANASCANPDTDETSQLGTTEDAILCLFDGVDLGCRSDR